MTSKSGVGHGETAPDRSELLGATRPTQSIGDSTIDGLRSWKYDNSAVPNPQLSSSRNGPRPNAHFGVFQRLYEEAFKNPNHAEMLYEKSVKAKVSAPVHPTTPPRRPSLLRNAPCRSASCSGLTPPVPQTDCRAAVGAFLREQAEGDWV